ncbi:hypothetical protein E2562_016748 [Oryza meyeriana var. granulata]|uniref:Uncharacterized protein n=1 Tax=Oryza meyeriana var. granulata TaxID=110450 RepID=A0A6G1BKY4_9ORYZ|nr:hypothetical protein E2562_016748 [Oryza meyeriana var. granulata]
MPGRKHRIGSWWAMVAPTSASSPMAFLFWRLPPRRDTLLRAVASLAASLVARARSISQWWNVNALTPLSAILECVLDDAANLYFHELYVVLFHVELLVSISSVGYAWVLLWNPDLATSFRDLNAELAVVLDVLHRPTPSV